MSRSFRSRAASASCISSYSLTGARDDIWVRRLGRRFRWRWSGPSWGMGSGVPQGCAKRRLGHIRAGHRAESIRCAGRSGMSESYASTTAASMRRSTFFTRLRRDSQAREERVPIGLSGELAGLVAVVRPDPDLLGPGVVVVGREDGRWRADVVHQPHGEQGRDRRPRGEVEAVDVGERPEYGLLAVAVDREVARQLLVGMLVGDLEGPSPAAQ